MAISHDVFVLSNLIHCAFSLIVYPEDHVGAKDLFRSWQQQYEKEYNLLGEDYGRFQNFHKNLKYINKLNKMHSGETTFALNQFADMTQEEFKQKILMPSREPPVFEDERYIKIGGSFALPDSFDWTPKNVVTSVKNQGAAGSCWAFSTIGNIEGQWAISGKPLTNLSVEQVVDCDGYEDVPRHNADCGVFGGWPYLAYQYIMRTGGLESWTDYPYCSGDTSKKQENNCLPCPAPGFNQSLCGPPVPYCNMTQSCLAKLDKSRYVSGLKVSEWKAIDKNETLIAEQLMKIGPLSIALNADWLMFYHSGVLSPPFYCDPKSINHAVLLVGFGKEKSWFGEKLYWKVKNSWGPTWGENGYFRIKRGSGVCGVNTQVTTAVLRG